MMKTMVTRSLAVLMLALLAASFTTPPVAKKFTPVGTWECNIVGVPPEYENTTMVIEKEGKEYKVKIGPSEEYMTEGENVVIKKKTIKFTIYVEYETVDFEGNFDGDSFKGTVSLSQGVFDINGKRVTEE